MVASLPAARQHSCSSPLLRGHARCRRVTFFQRSSVPSTSAQSCRVARRHGSVRQCFDSPNLRRKRLSLQTLASRTPPPSIEKRPAEADIRIRSEVEAPFRAVRLVLFGFFVVSASVGALIATTQALPLNDVATSLAIDIGAAALFAFLLRGDLQARDKQIARLTREERLGALRLTLANGKRVRVRDLQSFARVVIAAGSPRQVADAVAAAQPLREALTERGVLVVPLPIFEGGAEAASANGAPAAGNGADNGSQDDLRWVAQPQQLEEWRAWFSEQARLANASLERGLYVSLRLDGRVRGSGLGPPPWQRLVAQLAPTEGEGAWKGFFDGFDGRV